MRQHGGTRANRRDSGAPPVRPRQRCRQFPARARRNVPPTPDHDDVCPGEVLNTEVGGDARRGKPNTSTTQPKKLRVWLLFSWWALGDINCRKLSHSPGPESGVWEFRPVADARINSCVWEGVVIDFERRAWIRTILRESPDARAYLEHKMAEGNTDGQARGPCPETQRRKLRHETRDYVCHGGIESVGMRYFSIACARVAAGS